MYISKKSTTFAAGNEYICEIMATKTTPAKTFEVPEVEQQDVMVLTNHRFPYYGTEFISNNLVISLVKSGESHGFYDKKPVYIKQNDVSIVLPHHICKEQDTSDDYNVTLVIISPKFMSEVTRKTVYRNYIRFHYQPILHYTEEQCLALLRHVETIREVSEMRQLPYQHEVLLNLVDALRAMMDFYQQEQDGDTAQVSHGHEIYDHFCNLLVKHYKESREVAFYADKLHLTPKHFSKVIRQTTGHTASYWIEQHIAVQAQQMLRGRQDMTVLEICYYLGFDDLAHFSRYFKRATGLSPRQFRENSQPQ